MSAVSAGVKGVGTPSRPMSSCDQLPGPQLTLGVLDGTPGARLGTEQLQEIENQVGKFGQVTQWPV